MKRIKKMQSGSIYLLKGECGANSVFFESEDDAKLFMKYVDNYLGDFVEINNFYNNKDGWMLIITIKSEEKVLSAYNKKRSKSKKCKEEFRLDEVWRIISEQVRLTLSRYVKQTNALSGREGGKVKSSYARYYFESIEEAVEVMEEMDNQSIDQSQSKKRYRGGEALFGFTENELKGNDFMCCKWLREGKGSGRLGMKCLNLLTYMGDVLQKLIDTTLLLHLSTNTC